MPKIPTAWIAKDGSSTVTNTSGDLLLESGGHFLLEDGITLIELEGTVITPKEATIWTFPVPTMAATWIDSDGYSTVTTITEPAFRVSQDGLSIRLVQNGIDERIINETVVTPRIAAIWTPND